MIDRTSLEQVIEEFLNDSELFLVELKISAGNKISVFLDGDHGVPIIECVRVSRHIESVFDREAEDYELEVSSVGIDRPLKLLRQYVKNIGRDIQCETTDKTKLKGKLIKAESSGITIEKEKVKKKKNMEQDDPVVDIPFDLIHQVKVLVSFKSSKED